MVMRIIFNIAVVLTFQCVWTVSFCFATEPELCRNLLIGYSHLASVRLAGFNSSMVGYLEVCRDGGWRTVTVTSGEWGRKEATVVCKELGFLDAISFSHIEGRSLVIRSWSHFASVDCTGTERRLSGCSIKEERRSSPTARNLMDQVLVLCNKSPVLGTIRVVGVNSNSNEGILEVYHTHPSYKWSTVCGSEWTDADATVSCQQMGFSTGKSKLFSFDNSGRDLPGKRYDNFECNGTENTLLECQHTGPYAYRCQSELYAGVHCQGDNSRDSQITLYAALILLSVALLVILMLTIIVILICMARKIKKKRLSQHRGFDNPLTNAVYPLHYPDIINLSPPPTYDETIFNNAAPSETMTTAILLTQDEDASSEEMSEENAEAVSADSTEA
ncbi:neurotrypsin-like [Halichondria panicea]|uniref:neurotrypsin-like n=1 Tax=Halichondria panicea TaxID=6063 RepID=UPI00312B954B